MDVSRLALYAGTLRHLRAKQVAYLVLRRLAPAPRAARRVDEPARSRAGVAMQPAIARAMRAGGEREFAFLNVTRRFDLTRVDWASRDASRLWRYNLHYFDYALERGRALDDIDRLLSDWISRNPVGAGDGWEPYPASLRIVNWVKLFLRDDLRARVRREWLASLRDQTQWLAANLERHILANHYLKNAKALLFAGAYLAGTDADRWLRDGWAILLDEAREQILPDGGHYERSPMYHALVVEDLLDVLNLAGTTPGLVPAADVAFLRERTARALDFLHDICLPDGGIPLFNDSAFGVAASLAELAEYAERIVGYRAPVRGQGLHVASRSQSGYFVMRDGDDMLVVDCGEIGPDYQPGHAHCDTLSFELALDGRAIVVDSGVHDYDDSAMRRYVRGTRAHNTAIVDGCEQSELWGAFRVARRARPLRARIQAIGPSRARFSGSHDGYARLPGKPVHQRSIDYEARAGWTIVDTFHGGGEHRIETLVHLHPDLRAHRDGSTISLHWPSGVLACRLEVRAGADVALGKGWYCPQFGVKRENTVVTLSSCGPLPSSLGYRIAKPGAPTERPAAA